MFVTQITLNSKMEIDEICHREATFIQFSNVWSPWDKDIDLMYV